MASDRWRSVDRARLGAGVLLAMLATAVAAGTARAQAPGAGRAGASFHPDSSFEAERILRNAADHAAAGQWASAIDLYQKVLQQHRDAMVQVPSGPEQPEADPDGEVEWFVTAGRLCHMRLSLLPAEALAIYRRRVDAQAEAWYRQGASGADLSGLRMVVEGAFCSTWGDDALDLIGDRAFREGRFAEAYDAYRHLLPDEADRRGPASLTYPNPGVDLARVAAKKLLCREALGTSPPGDEDLKQYATAYPEAQGAFLGRSGPLARSLDEALRSDRIAETDGPDGLWPTLGGAMTRSKLAPSAIDVGSMQWKVDLKAPPPVRSIAPFPGRTIVVPTNPDRTLPYHPIVLGDQVVLCDADRIFAYNLGDRPTTPPGASLGGEVPVAWDQPLPNLEAPSARGASGAPRFSLTAHGDRIYARLGPPGVHSGASYLLAVRNDRQVEGKLLWRKRATEVDLPRRGGPGRAVAFEGSPVADDRRVFVGVTEPGLEISNYIVCLDAETGAMRWARFVGMAAANVDRMMAMPVADEAGGRLLSYDGAILYYQTNMGALAALDAETGAIRWLATYPHQDTRGVRGSSRDLNPAVVHDGLAIIAPDDAAAIYAFRAATGRLAWKAAGGELGQISHLLGVADGRLIATGNKVWTFDAETGRLLRTWPDAGSSFEGFGRGLLAGGAIYWPTRDGIQVLDPVAGGQSDRGPIPLQQLYGTGGGNLAVGDGYLVVAEPRQLVVYCQNSRLIERYREEIARSPDQPALYVRLARVSEAAGKDELALASLDAAIARASGSDTVDGLPLAEAARSQRFRLLMKLAGVAASGGDWAAASLHYERASESSRGQRDRLSARLHLADALDRGGDPARAVATLQALLIDDPGRLDGVAVAADERRTVRADLLIAERLAGLIRERGREVYAEYDRRARELVERGRADRSPRLLEEVGRTYPVARVVPEALLALGELHLSGTPPRPGAAAGAFQKLLVIATDDATRGRALLGLARSYEAQGLLLPAREAYARAQAKFADVPAVAEGNSATVGSLAAEALARENPRLPSGDRPGSGPSTPLSRRWASQWNLGEARPMTAEGTPPSSASGRIFLVEGRTLLAIDPRQGEPSWSAPLDADPSWIGYLDDRVVVATATRLVALNLVDGSALWGFASGELRPVRKAPNPFARAEPAGDRGAEAAGDLHAFRIVGGRIYGLRGDRELLAIEGRSGLIEWSFRPASGSINPHFWVGTGRVVLQARGPNAVVVLDAPTGLPRGEFTRPEEEPAWARDPLPIDDDRVALVVDDRTVALFDLSRGETAWVYREPAALPKSGPPRLLGTPGRLLVLRDGSELVRLDPETGEKQWSRLLGLEDLSEWPDGIALGGDRLYCANGSTLTAYNLADGSPSWRRYLVGPPTGWALALTDDDVLAYPSPHRSIDGVLDELPLVVCRRGDGRLVQRLVLPAPGSIARLAVGVSPGSVLVMTQDGGWSLGEWPPMDGPAPPR